MSTKNQTSGIVAKLEPKVSVVVPNHGRDISTLKAGLPKWVELIEVNRGLERSRQRNIGIREATGDILIILDSDHSLAPGTIEECVWLIKVGYNAVYIPEQIVAKSFFGRIRAFERQFYNFTAIDVPRCIRKKGCPEFDEEQHGTEDSDWANRIPGLIGRCKKGVMFHHDDISIAEYCRKKAYYTKSMRRYKERNPHDRCTNLKYRLWTVFTENGKWKELVKHPVLTLGVVFVLFLRMVIYYANR